MTAVDLQHGSATDVGHVRAVNEDSFLTAPPVFVVADGMGGHAGGDVASAMVVEEFAKLGDALLEPRVAARTVLAALERCRDRLREYAEGQGHRGASIHAGTTAVVAMLVRDEDGPRWLLANLGDSRVYGLGPGGLDQVSVDHSVVQELVDAGQITAEQAQHHPERHVITRALSAADVPEPDFFLVPLDAAHRLLLCTDGINAMIDDVDIERILRRCPDPGQAAAELVQAALDAGGRDNATAVVVDVVGLAENDDDSHRAASDETNQGALP
ncbi:protein phosphatase 2C domain-containing protein [Nocardioides sp. 616]|uniref:PP2C family protein-serine/threonine phosphatase n=1 Tax=Nocardioides sp. 616 TaxID=2268090 RepID=UPI000CE35864|nr:protein phosphatase 2C domain-containing protein [Nocardioides sp. 616]